MDKVFYNCIYMADLGVGVGSEQSGERPVLVVDSYRTSSVCVVIPITSVRLCDSREYHVDLSNGIGTALVEQIRAISKDRVYSIYLLNNRCATITEFDRMKINEQLLKICQLNPLFVK